MAGKVVAAVGKVAAVTGYCQDKLSNKEAAAPTQMSGLDILSTEASHPYFHSSQ